MRDVAIIGVGQTPMGEHWEKSLRHLAHDAILVAMLDGKTYVLDNQIPQVIEAVKIRHYDPVFSINQKFWWRHLR